ncbi:hypothetical protein Nepgr_009762 [Nepenthes gracilis]|uniref:Protein kinase domain-containing protein n=1 Tax=Nepenthes gracilis TaxID=150966 RepID=A0AAD3SBZ5_NEPGR|nr:hypothetical protein Nepgr_009762 [Nepenthes gracilis]
MAVVNFEFLIWVCSVFCLISVSVEFDPPDNYLIDCGSLKNTSVVNRVFMADDLNSRLLSTSQHIFVNTSSNSLSSTFASELYQTARILIGTSHFTFPIKKHARHWIRLYFFPFVHQNYNLSEANFSVSCQNFTLLRSSQLGIGPSIKEFSLNITSDNLVINFTPSADSFAFLNALEIVSVPDELIPGTVGTVDPPGYTQNLLHQALETIFRVNMGNKVVYPQNDTLSRFWVSDKPFLKDLNFVNFVSTADAVNYTSGGPSPEIAPSAVYRTASMLNSEFDPNTKANVTWFFSVDPGFEYLVRFHFCDFLSPNLTPGPLIFNVYINSWSVASNLDLSKQTSGILAAPYYMDVVTRASDNNKLSVSVGHSDVGNVYPNAILNGLEIMKINSSRGSLDASDSDIPHLQLSSKKKIGLIVASAAGALFILLVLSSVLFLKCMRRRKSSRVDINGVKVDDTGSIASASKAGYRFPLAAIQEVTENFSESLIIGIGGFGKVYKGVLKNETLVAVKRGSSYSQQGLAEFRTEIEMLSQFRHRHLVSLIGYCDEQNEMIIVYEFMGNGTLKNHLYGSGLPRLSWKQRLEICIGSARGLHYLHTGSAKAIIHRNVKSANILLDENFMAKVADFGLSKAGPEIDETHVSTAVKGSFGYLDPEYLTRQQLTEKSDVYSFGVVLFEILCGRPVVDPSLPREEVSLVEWAIKWRQMGRLEEIVDPLLAGHIKPESLSKFGETAEKCLVQRGSDRPTMGEVLWNLECTLQLQGGGGGSLNEKPELSLQTDDAKPLESSISTAQFSMGSARDIAGISMSRIFSEMMKAEMR